MTEKRLLRRIRTNIDGIDSLSGLMIFGYELFFTQMDEDITWICREVTASKFKIRSNRLLRSLLTEMKMKDDRVGGRKGRGIELGKRECGRSTRMNTNTRIK